MAGFDFRIHSGGIMAAQFQFVMRSGPDLGKAYPLEGTEIMIGREANIGISINDAEVSRKHAKLTMQGLAYVLQDLGSTNGTFVNGQRLTGPQALNPGDSISLGENIVLQYEGTLDPNATVLSHKASSTAVSAQKPAPMPAPTPAPAPSPAPVYAGQMPSGPVQPAAAAKKKGSRIWIVVVIIIILLLCFCVGVPLLVDALRMDCVVPFKWFFNIVGPLFGYGSCP
jgi:hypothetical protein